MNVYVLTREINEYNQEGEYFEGVFLEFPTRDQLIEAGVHNCFLDRLLSGKNGQSTRYESGWWNIRKVEVK